jgi:hypothetical protein
MRASALCLIVITFVVAGCAGDVDPGSADPDGGGGGFADGNPSNSDAANCGATSFQVEPAHANVLVLFDRSCSMRRQMDQPTEFSSGPADPKGRWFVARQAVDLLTQTYQSQVRFGLMVFPAPAKGCGDLPLAQVNPALMARKAILAALDQPDVVPYTLCTPPGSSATGPQPHVTPTAEALTAAASLPALLDTARESYILLVTDGYATCGATAASLAQQVGSSGTKTAVVGFGDADSAEAIAMLDGMAQAGGMPKPGASHKFWLAQSSADLQSALKAIVSQTVTCRFTLSSTPPDKDKLYAFLDGQQVLQNDADGWTYDAQTDTVTFQGKACQRIQQGQVKHVAVVFGCPDPKCVPAKEVCDGFDNDCDGDVDEGCIE